MAMEVDSAEDVRNYAESPEKLQELLNFSFASMSFEEGVGDFTAYPKGYNFEQRLIEE